MIGLNPKVGWNCLRKTELVDVDDMICCDHCSDEMQDYCKKVNGQ